MIHIVLMWVWGHALLQFGIAGVTLAGAVAVFILVPSTGLRHAAVLVACVATFFLIFAPRLYIEGINYEKAKWDAAEAAATKRADDARQQAESEVPPLPPAPAAPVPAPNGPSPGVQPAPTPAAAAARAKKPSRIRAAIHRVLHRSTPASPGVRGHDAYDRDNP